MVENSILGPIRLDEPKFGQIILLFHKTKYFYYIFRYLRAFKFVEYD